MVQWLLYKGYKKARAVRLGMGMLQKSGFPMCPVSPRVKRYYWGE